MWFLQQRKHLLSIVVDFVLFVDHDLKFCYKHINHILPKYFIDLLPLSPTEHHNYETRQVHRFRLPLVNHEFAKQSIKYRYINNLNNMSVNYKEKLHTHSQDGFKRYIKFSIIALNCNI